MRSSVISVRSLRVGVLLNGNLVEEKVFGARSPITIGQSLRCSLSIPSDGMPAEHVLFAVEEGQFILRTARKMTGRLAYNGHAPQILDGEATIALTKGARGKISIGDATILFQEVATPAKNPRPQLPASIRGTLFDRVDGRLALLVGGSLALHGALAIWAWFQDTDTEVLGKPSIAMTYEHDTVEITLPDELPLPTKIEPGPTTPTTPTTPGVATPPTNRNNLTPSNQQHIANQIPDPAQMRENAIAMANMLVNGGKTNPDGTAGTMDGRRPNSDLNGQIRDAQDRRVEIGTPSHVSRDGNTRIGTVDGPIVNGLPTHTEDPGHREELPPLRIVPGPTKPDPVTLTPEAIIAKINSAYMSGLQRCYAKGLLQDGNLAGKIRLSFTVNESGRVVDSSATGVGFGVDACVGGLMTGWTFPIPRDKESKEATDASYTLSLQLTR